MTTTELHDAYITLRAEHPTVPARHVIQWARTALEVERLYRLADLDEYPRIVIDGLTIEVRDDDEPYEWGDIEPTDEDRENTHPIGVIVGPDSIWNCGWDELHESSLARFAIGVALEYGMIDAGRERQEACIVRSVN